MTWAYDIGALDKEVNQVRFLSQENNHDRPLVQDEEIAWVLTQEMNVYMAAARIAELAAARVGPVRSKTVGTLTKVFTTPAEFKLIADQLRTRGSFYMVPDAGGLSIQEVKDARAAIDMVQDSFAVGMHDNEQSVVDNTNP